MSRRALALVILFVAALGIVVALAARNPSPTQTNNHNDNNNQGNTDNTPSNVAHNPPTNSDFVYAISRQSSNPTFATSGFSITSSSNPTPSWFIVKVAPDVHTDPLTALVRQNKDNTLTLVAGPSTQLAQSVLTPYNVPQTVLSKLPVIDDVQ